MECKNTIAKIHKKGTELLKDIIVIFTDYFRALKQKKGPSGPNSKPKQPTIENHLYLKE